MTTKPYRHLVFLIAFLLGCDNPVDKAPTLYDLYPLAIGNTWTYQYTDFDTLGTNTGSHLETILIHADTVIDGNQWFVYTAPYDHLIGKRADGIYYFSESQPKLWFKQPEIPPHTYVIAGSANVPIEYQTYMEVSLAGPDSVRYKTISLGHLVYDQVLVVGIGPTKLVAYGRTSSGREYVSTVRELTSYTLR